MFGLRLRSAAKPNEENPEMRPPVGLGVVITRSDGSTSIV